MIFWLRLKGQVCDQQLYPRHLAALTFLLQTQMFEAGTLGSGLSIQSRLCNKSSYHLVKKKKKRSCKGLAWKNSSSVYEAKPTATRRSKKYPPCTGSHHPGHREDERPKSMRGCHHQQRTKGLLPLPASQYCVLCSKPPGTPKQLEDQRVKVVNYL